MKSQASVSTPKTASKPKKRPLVKRGLPPTAGAGNILVVKAGEEIRENVQSRLDAMKKDYETVEFHWNKLITDPTYNETKEYHPNSQLLAKWELLEGVKTLVDFKTRMKRLKVYVDHFQPGTDYELTVNDLVEILS